MAKPSHSGEDPRKTTSSNYKSARKDSSSDNQYVKKGTSDTTKQKSAASSALSQAATRIPTSGRYELIEPRGGRGSEGYRIQVFMADPPSGPIEVSSEVTSQFVKDADDYLTQTNSIITEILTSQKRVDKMQQQNDDNINKLLAELGQ